MLVQSIVLSFASLVFVTAETTEVPVDPISSWTTLTAGPSPSAAITEFTSSFGIAPVTITDPAILSSLSSEASTSTLEPSSSEYNTDSASPSSESVTVDPKEYIKSFATKTPGTLELTLTGGILYDGLGRIGSIVANRQFQFDGPPPQAGAIYAVGWSITPEGNLAIGENDIFYQCLSGSFYNLYDQTLGIHCSAIYLNAVGFV